MRKKLLMCLSALMGCAFTSLAQKITGAIRIIPGSTFFPDEDIRAKKSGINTAFWRNGAITNNFKQHLLCVISSLCYESRDLKSIESLLSISINTNTKSLINSGRVDKRISMMQRN